MQLSKIRINALEEIWMEHKESKRQLKLRITELKQKHVKDFSVDAHYTYLQHTIESIEELLSTLDIELQSLAERRYLSADSKFLDWEEIGDELGMTKPKAYQLRTKLMYLTAEQLGWIPK